MQWFVEQCVCPGTKGTYIIIITSQKSDVGFVQAK